MRSSPCRVVLPWHSCVCKKHEVDELDTMRAVQKISDDWVFHDHFVPELIAELWDGEAVSLPHNAVKLPFNYFDEKCYQHAFIYQKKLPWQTPII